MVVQGSSALVKTPSVPRVNKSKPLKIEMMAEFVAEGAKECSERRDLLPHRCARPYPDQHTCGRVIPKKLCRKVLANSQRSRCKHAHTARLDVVEL